MRGGDGIVTARYWAVDFDTAEIETVVGTVCGSPTFIGAGEVSVEGGVASRFTCADGREFGAENTAGASFIRTGPSSAEMYVTHRDGGRLQQVHRVFAV